jgi:hypothetical protein
MCKLNKLALLSLLGGSMLAGTASAATCVTGSSAETSLQGIFDNMTVGGGSSVNAATDCLPDNSDSIWSITGSGLSGTTMIIEIAGQAGTNTFGVYDAANNSNSVQLFDGAASGGDQTVMSIKLDGSVWVNLVDTGVNFAGNSFGYYLGTVNGTFYSDTSLNGDTADHMLAYQGTGDTIQLPNIAPGTWTANEYALAWEDLPASAADFDYNDMVLMVESVEPVPVPAAVWLFGSGLLGLIGMARRKKA